jgi:hypothetical protein
MYDSVTCENQELDRPCWTPYIITVDNTNLEASRCNTHSVERVRDR